MTRRDSACRVFFRQAETTPYKRFYALFSIISLDIICSMQNIRDMATKYDTYSDKDIVQAIKTRLQFSQREIARMFYISDGGISRVLSEKIGLRPAVRKAMIDLLEANDHSFVIDDEKEG